MSRWVYPLDPECPVVAAFNAGLNDPIMQMSGCADEFIVLFEKNHRRKCQRCQEYGAANVEVE